ncbi:Uncharacterized membrane protein [Cetobacterium ceti]|uniref:Uncharacterized membrane protein n=1 Tax=Cetobacterium ceti TaxID=180163 RepID=A0A1T4LFS8_9FUSO|nr:DUF2207 domain-containing protein [Cetobacterium ceti]SJZ53486.1 Uncharacterized membrane protein [Cetobacterium ceti]
MLKLVFSLFLLFTSLAFGDSGYYIKNYNITTEISDKNIYKVNEKITAHFLQPRRGIFRVIPEKYNGRIIPITNVKTNTETYSRDEGDFLYLRLGNPNKYILGDKIYHINYDYNIGWDKNQKYDEVYYNLIGNDWNTRIDKLTFKITLPKPFNKNNINITLGPRDSTNTEGVIWTVNKNTISGYTTRPLKPGESITLALPLPEGYFNLKGEITQFYFIEILVNVLILLFPLIAFILYKKFGEKNIIVESVEFYPPEKMTPTELGYYIDGRINGKDLTSLIFYWANKGYIKLIDLKYDFEIIKLVEQIKSKNDFEIYLFNSLFIYSDNGIKIRISDLKNNFYKHIEKAGEIFETDLILKHRELYTLKSIKLQSLVKAFPIFIIGIIIGYFVYLNENNIFILSKELILGTISILLSLYFSEKIKTRTKFGNNILGKILGFKKFLYVAEKNKLEMLLDENPSYFYDILPYTIVLGVSEKWANKFKDLEIAPPEWMDSYNSTGMFSTLLLINSLNRSMEIFNENMLSAPKAPTNFGGGTSSMDGGSSGGGVGGGGGGSW